MIKINPEKVEILSVRVVPSDRSEINFIIKDNDIRVEDNVLIVTVDGNAPVTFGEDSEEIKKAINPGVNNNGKI